VGGKAPTVFYPALAEWFKKRLAFPTEAPLLSETAN
jgi:hypothetical protein